MECGGTNRPQIRTVADMSPQMRLVCESLVAGRSVLQISRALDVVETTVRAHISRAVKLVGVEDREHLIRWCKRGGQVRSISIPVPYPVVTARAADGATMVDIQVESALGAIAKRHPGKLLAAAGRLREEQARDRERARTASQDAPG